MTTSSRTYRFRRFHLLALLPTVGLLGGIPFVNRVEPFLFGLPFILFWIVSWVATASVIMAIIWKLDERADRAESAS